MINARVWQLQAAGIVRLTVPPINVAPPVEVKVIDTPPAQEKKDAEK